MTIPPRSKDSIFPRPIRLPRKPPRIPPTMPMTMVMRKPPGSFPGTMNFARAPAIRPRKIQERNPIPLSLSRSSLRDQAKKGRYRGLVRFLARPVMSDRFLEDRGLSLVEETDLVQELKLKGLFQQAPRRFVQRFIAQPEGSKVHGNHRLGAKFPERLQGLFRIHMNIPFRWR